ncbi:hypothetical protein OG756_42040 (plasmid) [Streptomyces sp. NBC_01310]|uniref:hypothetical protein n=1 Tax=Streptomyces TaxID=1883 RepID=UPI00224E90D3|nr:MULTISPECIES: hypothetical protein [Streptomyces]MCX5278073.1 hypothetical protein [Streptomyces virginiae]WSJ64472.1 hypothetical protein OG756_42040 [Streptomyces sp. NBC_01310]
MAEDTDTIQPASDEDAAQETSEDLPEEQPDAPQRWVWADMDPADREQRLEELVTWVDWLVETFDLRSQVARCWYRHPRLIEHFSALFIGWVRTYAGDPTKLSTRAELDWIKELYALLPRLNSASCQTKHIDPPPQSYSMAEAFDQWLGEADRPFLDSPRSHPAKEQVGRMAKAKRVEDAAKAKAKEAGTGKSA